MHFRNELLRHTHLVCCKTFINLMKNSHFISVSIMKTNLFQNLISVLSQLKINLLQQISFFHFSLTVPPFSHPIPLSSTFLTFGNVKRKQLARASGDSVFKSQQQQHSPRNRRPAVKIEHKGTGDLQFMMLRKRFFLSLHASLRVHKSL